VVVLVVDRLSHSDGRAVQNLAESGRKVFLKSIPVTARKEGAPDIALEE
jgi:hypothetical protein